jgi:hypothetical protein
MVIHWGKQDWYATMYEHVRPPTFPVLLYILIYSALPILYNLLLLYILIDSQRKIHYSWIMYWPGSFRFMRFYIFLAWIVTNIGLLWVYILMYFYRFVGHFCWCTSHRTTLIYDQNNDTIYNHPATSLQSHYWANFIDEHFDSFDLCIVEQFARLIFMFSRSFTLGNSVENR